MKFRISITACSVTVLCLLAFTQETYAQNDPYGLKTTAGAAGLQNDTPVTVLLGNVIGTALSLISVIFFALMIYGGFRWMLSRGNADEATKALDTIIAAIIGIIIVLASYAITNFVFSSLGTGGGSGGGAGGGSPIVEPSAGGAPGEPTAGFQNEAVCLSSTGCTQKVGGAPFDVGALACPTDTLSFGSAGSCTTKYQQLKSKGSKGTCIAYYIDCANTGDSTCDEDWCDLLYITKLPIGWACANNAELDTNNINSANAITTSSENECDALLDKILAAPSAPVNIDQVKCFVTEDNKSSNVGTDTQTWNTCGVT